MKMMAKIRRADWRAEFFLLGHSWERWVIHYVYTYIHRIEAILMGVELGRNVSFNGHITISRFKHSKIVIGDNCIFNSHHAFNSRGCRKCILHTGTDFACIEIGRNSGFSGVTIVANHGVYIGRDVMIGADSQIGDTDDHPERLGTKDAPIRIGNHVFIGMHCMIMKGVVIGDNAIIGAGSVVTKDIPENCIAAGVPCRVIRQR